MHKVMMIVGIRPDFIRTSKVIHLLDQHPKVELTIVHTGQHYDRELNDIFFEQLNIPKPNEYLNATGTHCEQHSKLILGLEKLIDKYTPDICVFLGDANAVIGCIAPLKKGVPIAHIEAGMRSYNWDMPEERNRVLIDRVSDILYVYQDDYRVQLVQEGVDPSKIEVVGNVIVDVINKYRHKFNWKLGLRSQYVPYEIVENRTILPKKYALMTLHRDEHMRNPELCQNILNDVGWFTINNDPLPVVLIEMPRLKSLGLKYPPHFIVTPPLGYFEFGMLERHAAIEYTDSGTNQESASIFGTPCVVIRDCTERPECRDSETTVMSGYHKIEEASEYVLNADYNEEFSLGDGKSSERIVNNLVYRLGRDGSRVHGGNKFIERHFELM